MLVSSEGKQVKAAGSGMAYLRCGIPIETDAGTEANDGGQPALLGWILLQHENLANSGITFRSVKVQDVAIGLEHVDFVNGLDRLYVELLESGMQLLVVGDRALAGSAFSLGQTRLALATGLVHIKFSR